MGLSWEILHWAVQSVVVNALVYAFVFLEVFTGPDFTIIALIMTTLLIVKSVLWLIFALGGIGEFGKDVLIMILGSLIVTFTLTILRIDSNIDWYYLLAILVFADIFARAVIWREQKNARSSL